MKILLVAKPWKGGLAKYLFQALSDAFPNQVRWLPTYPDSFSEHLRYRQNKSAWLDQLVTTINQTDYDVAIFVNYLSIFKKLRADRRHLLWMTDAPNIKQGEDTAFERIFISDLGYEQRLLTQIDAHRYQGELAFACYPKLHQPAQLKQIKTRDACFIGNKDPFRDHHLGYLLQQKIDVQVYGNYFLRTPLFWQYPLHVHAGVQNKAMQQIYAQHKLSINIHAKVVKDGTNMRTFECAAYQIPQVIDTRPGLSRFFEENALMVSEQPAQMLSHIHYLLDYPAYAEEMAVYARQIVLSQHTYYHRLLQALHGWLPADAEYRLQQASTLSY
ncbi:MAG: glycosyltransferase family 1 protein [Sulfuriferula sp.]|nr:glycosyltransferase family 1 protein [Sulfuriferula sp.]